MNFKARLRISILRKNRIIPLFQNRQIPATILWQSSGAEASREWKDHDLTEQASDNQTMKTPHANFLFLLH